MAEVNVIFNEKLCQAFKRADDFRKEENLNRIVTLFLVREIMQEADNEVYEYLQETAWDDREFYDLVENTFEKSIHEVVEKMRNEENNLSNQAIKVDINFNDHTETYSVSQELAGIIEVLISDQDEYLANEEPDEDGKITTTVDSNLFMEYIIDIMPKDLLKFFRRIGTNVTDMKEYILADEYSVEFVEYKDEKEKAFIPEIPYAMKSFIKDITAEIQPDGKELILGRDKESKSLWNIISKYNKRNAILVGDPGVGKTALIYKLATDIVREKCPKSFKEYRILSLDMTGLIAGTKYRGQTEERFVEIKKYLESNDKIILFIDEIHMMLGAGACENDSMDFANSMKPILAGNKAIVIGATTEMEYDRYFSRDAAIKRRFEKVVVREPKPEEVYPMLENQIKNLEEFHGVKVNKKIVDFIIYTAACFNSETRNPDRTLDLIDRSMVVAKGHDGKIVTKKDVLDNYDINFKTFEKMDIKEKKLVAYHEAGHFVMRQCSNILKEFEPMVVSIMPAEDYLGITLFTIDNEITVSRTLDYFIDSIACDLAGRVAERMYTDKDSSGASSDLNAATLTAYNVVTKAALIPDFKIAIIHCEDIDLQSEDVTNRINKSIEDLLKKAEERAETVLKENEILLKTLVSKLMERKMLFKKELEEICLKVKQNT